MDSPVTQISHISHSSTGNLAPLVDKYIGSAYDVVREVAYNLEYIKHISAHMESIYIVGGSTNGAYNIESILVVADNIDEIIEVNNNLASIMSLHPIFDTRAQLVAYVAANTASVAGRQYTANGLDYVCSPGSTVIADLPGLVPFGETQPQHFGSLGNGVADDTVRVQAAANWAVLSPTRILRIPTGIYKVGSITLPINLIVRSSKGAIIRHNGTITNTQYIVDIGNGVDFDTLHITAPGPGAGGNTVRIGDNVNGGLLRIASDVQWAEGGIASLGNSVVIDRIECINLDRPVYLGNPVPTTVTAVGTRIGFIYAKNYIRGLRVDNVSATIGGMRIFGSSPRDVPPQYPPMTPGHNGILIQGAPDLWIGDVWIEDSSEHCIRVGGPSISNIGTTNLRIGNVTAINCAGCTIKLNSGTVGLTENVQIGNVLSIDSGGTGGNQEILRLCHCRNVSIGNVLSVAQNKLASGQYGLLTNNARNTVIASLGGVFFNTFIAIDSTKDTATIADSGDVIGLRIGRLHGTTLSQTVDTAIGVTTVISINGVPTTYPINIGDIHIHCDGLTGFDTSLLRWVDGATITGVVRLTGWVGDTANPTFEAAPLDNRAQMDITWQGKRFVGRAADQAWTAFTVASPPFTGASTGVSTFTLMSGQAAPALGGYGSAIEFTRLASGRRGAAIAIRQGADHQRANGIDFLVSNVASTANETLSLALRLTYAQRLEFYSLTKYADNAAAVAAGLPLNTFYWTTTGEARVVV